MLLFAKGPYDKNFWRNGSLHFGNLLTRMVYYWMNIKFIFSNAQLLYFIFYLIVSVCAFSATEVLYCMHLFDIIVDFFFKSINFWKGSLLNAKKRCKSCYLQYQLTRVDICLWTLPYLYEYYYCILLFLRHFLYEWWRKYLHDVVPMLGLHYPFCNSSFILINYW